MKLYEFNPAPNPRRVRIFIAEKGLEISTEQVDLPNKEHLSPDFLNKNPMCDVPILELDDGTCISQVNGICRYLEAAHPEPNLFGRDAKEQGLVAMWDNYVFIQGFLAVADGFRNSADMFKGHATLGTKSYEQIPTLAERGLGRAGDFFDNMNRFLADKEFVAGDHFSVADITAIVTIDFAKAINISINENQPNLKRWYDSINKRPSITA